MYQSRIFPSIVVLLSLCLLSTSCGVKKRNAIGHPRGIEERFEQFRRDSIQTEPFQVNGHVTLDDHQAQTRVSSKINLFVAPGRGILFSIRPMAFVEAARVYLLPEEILFQDRINKLYIKLSYEELSEKLGGEVSYSFLERIFFGSHYKPNDHAEYILDAEGIFWETKSAQNLRIGYVLDSSLPKPNRFIIDKIEGHQVLLTLFYGDYRESSLGLFPAFLLIRTGIPLFSSLEVSFSFEAPRPSGSASSRIVPPALDGYHQMPF